MGMFTARWVSGSMVMSVTTPLYAFVEAEGLADFFPGRRRPGAGDGVDHKTRVVVA